MTAGADAITVNGIAVDPADGTTPELATVRELLRQRAIARGLLAHEAGGDDVVAAIETLLEREVAIPSPTEAECRRYYDTHADSCRSGDLVFVRHILFQVTPGCRIDLLRSQAEETLAQVVAAPDEFEACAFTLSNCPSGRQGGNLGQIGRGDTVPEFEQAIFADKWIGILQHLVKTRFGFHIVSIDRRVDGELVPFDAMREHIAERLTQRVQEAALKQYVALLAGEAEIEGVTIDAASTPLVQ